ncbi:FAD/NAD(P)-binding domain-containing protein [Lojkania enalia]|uniref:FAD/NAD(P)-binding domain-containing protein n=1 Tax=Lojkania enalia TaxID=147567 RepID=A0A9P4K0D7_9PLEO|nr:FAD/NAD(P)-binding domain-containing protein [Didymosphaeria enalia]
MSTSHSNPVDVLIIGGGPAGLTTALSVARNDHTAIMFDSQEYRNDRADHFHMIPTWDGKSPQAFRDAARTNTLENYTTTAFQNTKIVSVKKMDDGLFVATDDSGIDWYGRSLVLATGVIDVMYDLPGYEECWGRSIFHCLFCHGHEQRGSESSGVLAIDDVAPVPFALHVARNAAQLTKNVTLYTNGDEKNAETLQAAVGPVAPITVDYRKITKLALGENGIGCTLTFEDGSTKYEAFIAHKPKQALKSRELIDQLGLELTPKGDILVNPPFGETSVSGIFAAGDNSNSLKTTPNAITLGSNASAGVASHVQSRKYGHKSLSEFLRIMQKST